MIEIPLKRGYSITLKPKNKDIPPIIDILGNYSKSNYMATVIVNDYGLAPTVRENHGQVTAIVEEGDK